MGEELVLVPASHEIIIICHEILSSMLKLDFLVSLIAGGSSVIQCWLVMFKEIFLGVFLGKFLLS